MVMWAYFSCVVGSTCICFLEHDCDDSSRRQTNLHLGKTLFTHFKASGY